MARLHDPAMFQANTLFMAHIPACCAMLALLLQITVTGTAHKIDVEW